MQLTITRKLELVSVTLKMEGRRNEKQLKNCTSLFPHANSDRAVR